MTAEDEIQRRLRSAADTIPGPAPRWHRVTRLAHRRIWISLAVLVLLAAALTVLVLVGGVAGRSAVDPQFRVPVVDPRPPVLTVTLDGEPGGRVRSEPAGIDCGSDCAGEFQAGSAVTLTAEPEPGSTFAGWQGACTGQQPTCTVTMDASRRVIASFARPAPVTVTVTVVGEGTGTVLSTPRGIACTTGSCTAQFQADSEVRLRAVPAPGSVFEGWQGDCAPRPRVCAVTMDAPRSITASFRAAR